MRRNRLNLSYILVALGLLAVPLPARAADPIRIVVLSRYAEAVQEAVQVFEKKHGADLVAVTTGESEIAPEMLGRADAIVFHYLGGAVFERYAAQAKAAADGA